MANISNNVMNINGPLLHKRGTTAALEASDYVPAAGEIIIATDNGRIKAGDGVHTWAELPAYDETTINNTLRSPVLLSMQLRVTLLIRDSSPLKALLLSIAAKLLSLITAINPTY